MTPDAKSARLPADILADRLAVVLALTEANAAHRLAQSRAGGAGIELMSLEERAAEAPSAALAAQVEAARGVAEDARASMAATEARIEALDARLDALDAELAGAKS